MNYIIKDSKKLNIFIPFFRRAFIQKRRTDIFDAKAVAKTSQRCQDPSNESVDRREKRQKRRFQSTKAPCHRLGSELQLGLADRRLHGRRNDGSDSHPARHRLCSSGWIASPGI